MRRTVEEQAIVFQGKSVSVTISVGGSEKQAAEHISQSIQRADAALYWWKEMLAVSALTGESLGYGGRLEEVNTLHVVRSQ